MLEKILNKSLQDLPTELQCDREDKTRKLSGDAEMRVLTLLSTYVKVPDIVAIIRQEFGIAIGERTIYRYKTGSEHQKTIQRIREKWTNEIQQVELSNKRRRLEELSRIYEKCFSTNQMKNALASLHQIQGEVEKASDSIQQQNNFQFNIYKEMTEQEIEEERLKILGRIKNLKKIEVEPEITVEVKEE
jgi:hypothetical protein